MNDWTGAGTKNTHRAAPARSHAKKAMGKVVSVFLPSSIPSSLVGEVRLNNIDSCGIGNVPSG
jgi:hypothetical protein